MRPLDRPMRTLTSTLLAALLALWGAATSHAEIGIPADGQDLVELQDRRVVRCQVGERADGHLTITIGGETLRLPESKVRAVRLWRDYDSKPASDAEKEKVAKGLVEWAGKWMKKDKADALRAAEEARIRKLKEEDEFHSKWENHRVLETKHFKIHANIAKHKLDFYASALEEFYERLSKAFGLHLKGKWKKFKLPVIFFKHREEYLKRRRDSGRDKGEFARGHFVPTPGREELVMFDDPSGPEETLPVLYHEATHFLVYLSDPDVMHPRWMNEASAEYWGGAYIDDEGELHAGLVQDDRTLSFIARAKSGRLETIEELFESGNQGASPGLTKFPPAYYDQSWLIGHYAMNTPKLKKRWQTYIKKILNRKIKTQAIEASKRKYIDFNDDIALFKSTMKVKDFKQFQKDLLKYAEKLPLRKAMGYVRLGEMRMYRSRDRDGAFEAWKAAEDLAQDDPDALFRLGWVYRQIGNKEQRAKAPKYFKRSVELDPLDVRKRVRYAGTLSDETEQLRQLKICYYIDPEHVEVLKDLAFLTYRQNVTERFKATSDKSKAAVEECYGYAQKAVELAPDHTSRYILAVLCMHKGMFDEAATLQGKAIQEEPEHARYRRWMSVFTALAGDGPAFAKNLRKGALLAQRKADGDADEATATVTDILEFAAAACRAWKRPQECARAFKAWFRRPAANRRAVAAVRVGLAPCQGPDRVRSRQRGGQGASGLRRPRRTARHSGKVAHERIDPTW